MNEEMENPGDPDKINLDKLPVTGDDLFGREKELELLDQAWKSDETSIVALTAPGGTGKLLPVCEAQEALENCNFFTFLPALRAPATSCRCYPTNCNSGYEKTVTTNPVLF